MRKYANMIRNLKKKRSNCQIEVGVKQAAAQLGILYYSLADWRQKRKAYGDHAFVGSGIRRDELLNERGRQLMEQIRELQKANEILKDELGFFAKDRRK